MAVLYNDVVVGRLEYHINLNHHLDQKPLKLYILSDYNLLHDNYTSMKLLYNNKTK